MILYANVDDLALIINKVLPEDLFKKVSTRFELPDGAKLFGKQIMQQPEKYFTEDVMTKINEYCKEKFLYGTTKDDEGVVQVSEESSE